MMFVSLFPSSLLPRWLRLGLFLPPVDLGLFSPDFPVSRYFQEQREKNCDLKAVNVMLLFVLFRLTQRSAHEINGVVESDYEVHSINMILL